MNGCVEQGKHLPFRKAVKDAEPRYRVVLTSFLDKFRDTALYQGRIDDRETDFKRGNCCK
jgi:hypothetical protein